MNATSKPPRRRPRFQFSLLGLMVLMFAAAAAAAPGYYLMHGANLPQSRLVGMLMLLAGPLLLTTVLSVFLSLVGRNDEP
jgi:hypothetical protein